MEHAANTYPDRELRCLMSLRMQQLSTNYPRDRLHEIVHFLIVEPGDSEREIAAELQFSLLHNISDGSRFGSDEDFQPSFEWAACHGAFFELVFILTDDGFGTIVFVANDPGIDGDVHALCLEFACCPP
jgi:hypothetical protein